MKRSKVQALSEPEWVKVSDLDGLEVQVKASSGGDLASVYMSGDTSPALRRSIVQQALVGFRGYTDDDGKDLPNTAQYRAELLAITAVQLTVMAHLHQKQTEVFQGEDGAASD